MAEVPNYVPVGAPAIDDPNVQELARYVQHELETIARALQKFSTLQFEVLHVEPSRPREGLFAVADGSDWNPGSGGGPYAYFGGSWVALS